MLSNKPDMQSFEQNLALFHSDTRKQSFGVITVLITLLLGLGLGLGISFSQNDLNYMSLMIACPTFAGIVFRLTLCLPSYSYPMPANRLLEAKQALKQALPTLKTRIEILHSYCHSLRARTLTENAELRAELTRMKMRTKNAYVAVQKALFELENQNNPAPLKQLLTDYKNIETQIMQRTKQYRSNQQAALQGQSLIPIIEEAALEKGLTPLPALILKQPHRLITQSCPQIHPGPSPAKL